MRVPKNVGKETGTLITLLAVQKIMGILEKEAGREEWKKDARTGHRD